MLRLNKKLLNEKGLTLIELLAVIILMSIIAIFVVSLIIQSTETTREIQAENSLRDEADLIMSTLIKALYETNQSHIIQNETGTGYSYLNVTSDPSKCTRDETTGLWKIDDACKKTFQKIGFETSSGITRLIIKDEIYEIQNTNVKLLQNSMINGDPNKVIIYEIVLNLEYVTNRGGKEIQKGMEFKNEIQPF